LSIGISWDQPINDFAAGTLSTVEAAVKQMPNVGKVTALASAADTDIPAQIQQYESLLQQKPSLLILATTAGQPFVPLVAKAAQEGIPTISVLATVNSPDAVSIVPNTYLAALQTTENVVKQIGGKGNALMVQGIPGISITTDATNGINAVLKNCPNIKTLGTITGEFQPSVAKAQAISFLGTHPQTLNLVLIGGGMSSGVISAFEQTGRAAPAITDQSITKATAGYWLAHKSTFKASISGGGAVAFGQLVNLVTEKMLAGDGLKVSSVVQPQPIITPSDIGDWAQPSWTLSTPGTAPDPTSAYDNPALVDPLFNK
jgi:ribose transport system substrate-binding protein